MSRVILDLYDRRNKINRQILKIQNSCKHKEVIKVDNSNTGNWCPDDDSYWYECHCPDCGKCWLEDQ